MAYARAGVFRQTLTSVTEGTIAGMLILESARFQFGAMEVASVARGPNPNQCTKTPLQAEVAKSLNAEQELRAAFLSYSNPTDTDEENYVWQWASSLQTFDPTDHPPAVCEQLPTLTQQSLVQVPFTYPTTIVVTPWLERKPLQVCQPCPGVTHCSQLISSEPRCVQPLEHWWQNATKGFILLAQGLPLEPRLTGTVALGQDCLIPCARRCIYMGLPPV